MKLALALSERADLRRRTAELSERLNNNASSRTERYSKSEILIKSSVPVS